MRCPAIQARLEEEDALEFDRLEGSARVYVICSLFNIFCFLVCFFLVCSAPDRRSLILFFNGLLLFLAKSVFIAYGIGTASQTLKPNEKFDETRSKCLS